LYCLEYTWSGAVRLRDEPTHLIQALCLDGTPPLEKDGYRNAIFVLREDESTDNGEILITDVTQSETAG
jgi:hypothetical protein